MNFFTNQSNVPQSSKTWETSHKIHYIHDDIIDNVQTKGKLIVDNINLGWDGLRRKRDEHRRRRASSIEFQRRRQFRKPDPFCEAIRRRIF